MSFFNQTKSAQKKQNKTYFHQRNDSTSLKMINFYKILFLRFGIRFGFISLFIYWFVYGTSRSHFR